MTREELLVSDINPSAVHKEVLLALNTFDNAIHSETWSGEGEIPLEQTIEQLRPSPGCEHSLWVTSRSVGGKIVARADTFHFERDVHLMYFQISVLPEMRCRDLHAGSSTKWLRRQIARAGNSYKQGPFQRYLQARHSWNTWALIWVALAISTS